MRTTLLTAAAVVLCVTATGLHAQRQVTLMATVTDPGGAEVTALEPGDIKFAENGTDGKALKVEAIDSVPKVQILIDNGVGISSDSLTDLRNGVRGLRPSTNDRPCGGQHHDYRKTAPREREIPLCIHAYPLCGPRRVSLPGATSL